MYGTAHGLAIAACAGGGERACGGVRSGGRERDGRARLLARDGGMACPQAKAHDYGVSSAGHLERGGFSRRYGMASTL